MTAAAPTIQERPIPFWRDRMTLLMGMAQWKGLYAVISLIGFIAIIWGYSHARATPIIGVVEP